MRIKIVFLHAPIALSSSCQFNFIVSSPPSKYGGGEEGAIDFSFLKKKIVAVWDVFAYEWDFPCHCETGSCWKFVLKKGEID